MKYFEPEVLSAEEISQRLQSELDPEVRIELVLSAIYHCSEKFAGDTLIGEFEAASDEVRSFGLKNLFSTYYEVRETAYRIIDSITLLKLHAARVSGDQVEVEIRVGDLIEHASRFDVRVQ